MDRTRRVEREFMVFGTGVKKVPQWTERHKQSSEVGSTSWWHSEQTVWLHCWVNVGETCGWCWQDML